MPDDDAPRDDAPSSTPVAPTSTPVALPSKPMVAIDPIAIDPGPDVPRIPRGRGFKLSGGELIKIAMLGTLLVAILILQKPCADSVAKLVTSFGSDGSGSASTAMPKPDNVEVPQGYVRITPDMTPEQVKAAIEQARQQAHGQGSALAPSTPTPTTSTPTSSPTNPSTNSSPPTGPSSTNPSPTNSSPPTTPSTTNSSPPTHSSPPTNPSSTTGSGAH